MDSGDGAVFGTWGWYIVPKDPVCGLDVLETRAAGSSTYEGKKYYFCSLSCKGYFDKSPGQYATKKSEGFAFGAGHAKKKEGFLKRFSK